MNIQEAKAILLTHRPTGRTAPDPEMAEALEYARQDPALQAWLEQQQTFHITAQLAFRGIPVPRDLKQRILAEVRIVRVPWWQQPGTWAVAAALALLATVLAVQFKSGSEGTFPTFRSRMVRTVLREYRMGVVTNNMANIRQFLGTNGAPADYTLPAGLSSLAPMGAGILSWQGQRVSMVCLNGGKAGTLFLFIAATTDVTKLPAKPVEYAQVNKLATVSWIDSGKLYVLAGEAGEADLRKRLGG